MTKPEDPHILMIGPPGSGKGTHGRSLAKTLDIPLISTGDLLRMEMMHDSPLGRKITKTMNAGELVGDGDMLQLLRDRLFKGDCRHGWILDGYPRRLSQARMLDVFAEPNLAVVLLLGRKQADQRLAGRLICDNGHIYHLKYKPPRRPKYCDLDSLSLEQRADDISPTVRRHRLHVYNQEASAILQHYQTDQNIAMIVDAALSIDEVSREIIRLIKLVPRLALRFSA